MENPSFRFTPSQELVLKATPQAVKVAADGPPASGAQGPPVRAKKWEEVEAEARARVVSEGGNPGAEMVVLSRCAVQFGKYRGQTFKWMMENDVGYMVHLVTVHQKEREREGSVSQHPLMANKDALTRYSCAYPAFSEMVRFNRAHEEAEVLSSQPGQEGKALVGIGKYKWDTLQDLYEATGADRIKYVRSMRTQTPLYPGSAMAALIDYIQRRDREGVAAVARPAAASTIPASNTRPNSAATPLGPAISAFLSRRSLAPGELQAKMNKLIASQPAVQGVSFPRPALPPTDISDAELVKAAADIDTSQGNVLLHPSLPRPLPPNDRAPVPALVPDPAPAPALLGRSEEEDLPRQSFLPPRPASESAELLLPESWRSSLTKEQQRWIGRTLFTRDSFGRSTLTTDLVTWWNPPQPRPIYNQPPASPEPFFACQLFLWMPVRMWAYKLACPQSGCRGTLCQAGLYKTIRRVLDIDRWYLMATEYLECGRCKKKVAGWSRDLVSQLDARHRCQFPAILTYKLSCDLRVVRMLRSRTLGNSASQTYSKLCESHSESWMRCCIRYLGECKQFLALGIGRQFTDPPEMPPVPSPVLLLTVYNHDVLSRLDEVKARVTSVFGTILKMDSTKKVTKKLAGTAADTAAWVTNVGNEHGQVLVSVLTAAEGEGLLPMAAGLMERYRLAGVAPPQLMYVDRDCCSSFGGSKTAAMFNDWDQLVVRLDIWHLMGRFASGVTTESHQLYGPFMRQLSACIFEWDAGDVRRLLKAKRSEMERKHGMVGLTEAEVSRKIGRKEMALHCRRRTRGAAATEVLLLDLLETFNSEKGVDTLGIPLLDSIRIQAIWKEQRRHLHCIQDPPGVQLYTETGKITKGGVMLPVYRCARGSTSLESFHLHLNRFIPGTKANAMHFQAFLLDGLVRWNEDRARAAVEGKNRKPLLSYSGHLQHILNLNSQIVLGKEQVKDYTKPSEYTGELLGVEYLYSQTGRVLQDVSADPDLPEEAAAVEQLDEEDEGFQEEDVDPTVHIPPHVPPMSAPSSSSAAPLSGGPADAPRSGPSSPTAPEDGSSPEAPGRHSSPHPDHSSDSEEETKGPDAMPGDQHVRRLARALVGVRNRQGLSDRRVDGLVALWLVLPDFDKQRLIYPARHQERIVQGRFKTTKGKSSIILGKDSLQRLNSGPANWPGTSRLVEAICSQLCQIHPSATQSAGVKKSRWALILSDYVGIREAVLNSPRLMAQTNLQLFELNQRTISQWYSRRQKERMVLQQGMGLAAAPSVTTQPLPAAKPLHFKQEGIRAPFPFPTSPSPPVPRQTIQQGEPAHAPILPAHLEQQPPALPGPSPAQGPQTGCSSPPPVSRTTAWRRRKRIAADTEEGTAGKRRQREHYVCSKCGLPKRRETGHSRFGGVAFCSVAAGGKDVAQWLAEMKDAKGRGEGH